MILNRCATRKSLPDAPAAPCNSTNFPKYLNYCIILCYRFTGLPNKVCPRLRDSACWRSGEITQPRTSLIGEPCTCLRAEMKVRREEILLTRVLSLAIIMSTREVLPLVFTYDQGPSERQKWGGLVKTGLMAYIM